MIWLLIDMDMDRIGWIAFFMDLIFTNNHFILFVTKQVKTGEDDTCYVS